MSAQPVPTLEQRRALAAYLADQREAIHHAERYEPTHKMEMDLPVPSAWQLIREEYRDNPAAFLFTGLIWLIVLGIGLVMLAVRQGWVS